MNMLVIVAFVQSLLVLYNYIPLCDYAILYTLFFYGHLKGVQFLGITNNTAVIIFIPVFGHKCGHFSESCTCSDLKGNVCLGWVSQLVRASSRSAS